MLLTGFSLELVNISCLPSSTLLNALVTLDDDVSAVLPYLNAVLPRANYRPEAEELDFIRKGHIVTVRPREMRVTGVDDEAHARAAVEDLRELINATWEGRDRLEPVRENRRPPAALEVLRELPRTNCGACGVPTCMAFASLVSSEGAPLDRCPPLSEPTRAAAWERLLALGCRAGR